MEIFEEQHNSSLNNQNSNSSRNDRDDNQDDDNSNDDDNEGGDNTGYKSLKIEIPEKTKAESADDLTPEVIL